VWSPHKAVFFLLFVKTYKNGRRSIYICSTLSVYFCRGHQVAVVKLKDNKTVSGFSETQQYIILFYLDDINNIFFYLMESKIYIILFYRDDINSILFYFLLITSKIYYFILS